MKKPTFYDFKAYVEAQPAGRRIDHAGGWGSCAVGDFLRDFHSDYPVFRPDDFERYCTLFAAVELPRVVRETLLPYVVATFYYSTYGELTLLLWGRKRPSWPIRWARRAQYRCGGG